MLGKINFIQICVVETSSIFIFDMSEFFIAYKHRALNPKFSDDSISKFMFDCRSDSDALYHQLNIKLSGMVHVQLYEIGFRKCMEINNHFMFPISLLYYHGLLIVLDENFYQIDVTLKDFCIKEKYKDQLKLEILNVNLDDEEVLRFSAIDVIYLKNLCTYFNGGISDPKIRSDINDETKNRENYWMNDVFIDSYSKVLSVI